MLIMNKDLINGEVQNAIECEKPAYSLTVSHEKTMM